MDIPRRPALVIASGALVVLGAALALTQPWLLLVDERVSEAVPVAATAPATAPTTAPTAAAGTTAATASGTTGTTGTTGTAGTTTATTGDAAAGTPTAAATTTVPPTPAGPTELARGELVSHEHATTGTVRVLELEDGSRVLRIEGLDTSNGPDLRVWLSDAPVTGDRDGWFVFDDGAHVDLGPLQGNQGDANYEVPAEVDLGTLTSVSIWCARFRVSFGAAELA